MKLISNDWIEKSSDKINELSPETVNDLIGLFKEHQPFVMTYLLAVEYELLDEEEREALFFIGIKIWYATYLVEGKLTRVTEQVLEEMERKNDQMIEYFELEDEQGFSHSVDNIMEHHKQRDLMGFAVVEVMEEESIRDEVKGAVFISLKTIIESLDASTKN